jgi:RNA polymerase sigma-70 factor (ECF subfamily)
MPFLREHPELLAQFRAGVMAAFDAVYHAYKAMLDTLLRVAFKIKDANKRADILHDTFIRVWKPEVRLAYDGVRDFGPYISKIAGNLYLDSRRRTKREVLLRDRASSPDEDPLTKLLEAKGVVDPEAEHGWLEPRALAIARDYIASLTEPLRSVHTARYVECLSFRVAAVHLGINVNKLRTLEDQLRRELRARLEAAGIRASNVPSVPREDEDDDG